MLQESRLQKLQPAARRQRFPEQKMVLSSKIRVAPPSSARFSPFRSSQRGGSGAAGVEFAKVAASGQTTEVSGPKSDAEFENPGGGAQFGPVFARERFRELPCHPNTCVCAPLWPSRPRPRRRSGGGPKFSQGPNDAPQPQKWAISKAT